MIIDSLDYIERYQLLSKDIYEGLLFLKSANMTIDLGVYPINKEVDPKNWTVA